VTAQIK